MQSMYINGEFTRLSSRMSRSTTWWIACEKALATPGMTFVGNHWEPLRKERKPQVDRLPPRVIAALDRIATQGLCHTMNTAAAKGKLRYVGVINGKATGAQLLI